MFMLRDEIPTSSERAAVIAATISGCMPCGLGAGAGAAAGAAAAAAGAFSLPLRIAPIAMVRKMMQIRPKNTVDYSKAIAQFASAYALFAHF